ncbi:hypothetical protein KC352_g26932, partial [Hortaea werneckii]
MKCSNSVNCPTAGHAESLYFQIFISLSLLCLKYALHMTVMRALLTGFQADPGSDLPRFCRYNHSRENEPTRARTGRQRICALSRIATNFIVASPDGEHADAPSDDPVANCRLATGANDGNAAQAAAAVNSSKCAPQLDHSVAMSTTSESGMSDDSMNPRLDNLTPPESPGEPDPLYTA